jgi:hypothetical protein
VGERQEQPFELSFNGRLKVDFQGSRVTLDGGLLGALVGWAVGLRRTDPTALDRRARKEHAATDD